MMEGLQLSRLQKNVIFGIFVFLTILIAYVILSTIENSGKHTLTVNVLPLDSVITINGVKSSKDTHLRSGVYTIIVEKEGFATDTQTINLEKDYAVSSFLVPTNSETKQWFNDNLNLYPEAFEPRTTTQLILNQLPYKNSIYSISVSLPLVAKIPLPITIKSYKGYYNAPIEKIRAFGYDPENYVYEFNYENPFK